MGCIVRLGTCGEGRMEGGVMWFGGLDDGGLDDGG